MNETRKIKCPLCGAPSLVAVIENPHDCQIEAVYHYEEPRRSPAIMGYDLDHLQLVAKLMHQHGLTPEDLHDLKDNFQRAANIMHLEQERIAQDVVARLLAGFQPAALPDVDTFRDVFPDIKLKQEEVPKE